MPKVSLIKSLRSALGKLSARLVRERKEWQRKWSAASDVYDRVVREKRMVEYERDDLRMQLANERMNTDAAVCEMRLWRNRCREAENKWSCARWGVRIHGRGPLVTPHRQYHGQVGNMFFRQLDYAEMEHRVLCNMLHKVPGVQQIQDSFIVPAESAAEVERILSATTCRFSSPYPVGIEEIPRNPQPTPQNTHDL